MRFRSIPSSPVARRLARTLSILAALAGGLSCGREVTGPGDGTRLIARNFAFALEFGPIGAANGVASALVPFERVRVTLDNVANARVVDRTIDFPSTSDSVAVALDVPLSQGTGTAGESMVLRMAFVNAAGDTVFRALPQSVTVVPTLPGQPPVSVPTVQVVPTGPAANAASVLVSPQSASVVSGDPFTFTAQALDAQGTPLSGVPIGWISLDTAIARIPVLTSGAGTTRPSRGLARIVAVLPGGQSDTVTVAVAPRATALEVASGSGQTGQVATALASPIVARVRATDGLPMSGVKVAFSAANGGAVSADTVVTDVNGLAAATWTLGASAGAQSATATATGLTGSPITFTATGTGAVASQLTFTAQPATTVLGASIAPPITVTARDAQGNVATTFTGAVTIALGTNPSATTLGGTTTVNAVAGVATFSTITVGAVGTGYTLTATATGLSTATSAAFDIIAGPAALLAFTVQPQSLPAGGTISPAVVVTARDVNGATATSFTGAVTIALGANPGGSTLTGTLTVNAVAGVATFSGLSLNNAGAGYTLTAAATGLTGATSSAFAVTTGVIAWTNAAGGNWSVASNWNLGRVPVTTDSVVIALAGTYTVTLDTTFTASNITVGGASGAQTLVMSNRTLTVSGALATQGTGKLSFTTATVTGSGTLVNAATGSVSLRGTTVGLAVQNAGTIDGRANVTLSGALTTAAGSVLSVTGEGFATNGTFTVSNGFTNTGTIRIDFVNTTGGQTSAFAVTTGTLVNAAGGVIEATATSPTATRFLNAQLDNQGTVQLRAAFQLTASGAGSNTGSIIGDSLTTVTVAFSGTTPTFTNGGSIVLPAGRSWTTTGTGTFTMASGSTFSGGSYASNTGATTVLQMAPSVSSIGSTNGTLTIGSGVVLTSAALPLSSATVNGAGSVVLPQGSASTWRNATVAVPVQLAGTIDTRAATTVSGVITTTPTAVLRVAGEGFATNGTLAITSGLVNNGTVELDFVNTTGGQITRLEVTGGTLVNAAGAVIRATATSPTAGRQLAATLDNQGSLLIDAVTTLTVSGANTSAGAITLGTTGSLGLVFSGTTPTFSNTGAITIPTGRSWVTSNPGTITMAAASSVTGGGSYSSNGGAITVWQLAPTLGSVGADGGTLNVASGVTIANADLPLNSAGLTGAGAIVVSAGRSALWRNVTTALPVTLSGTLDFRGTSTFNGALTMDTTGVLRVTGEGFASNGILTIANGFTNVGTIELDFANGAGGQITRLQLTSGTLVNAPNGIIRTTANFPTAQRQLAAALDNQGSMVIDAVTAVTAAGTNTSTGSITLGATGTMTFAFSGAGATFSQAGALTIPTGRTWTTTGAGTFTFGATATVTGGGSYTTANTATTVLQMVPTLATFGADNGTITIASGVTVNALDFPLNASTVNGPGSLVLGQGRSALWRNSTIAVPFLLEGTLDVRGSSAMNAALTTTSTAILKVTGEGFASNGILTVANGFTNNGSIDLDFVNGAGGQTTQLVVTAGTLVNAAGAQLRATANTPTAGRLLNAALDNQGSVAIDAVTTINARGATTNPGSIVLGANGTVTLAFGTGSPTFTHTGTLTIPTGRSWTTTGVGTVTVDPLATVNGGGAYASNNGATTVLGMLPSLASIGSTSGTLTLGSGVTLAAMAIPLNSATVNGSGAVTVSAGQSMLWRTSTLGVPVLVEGTLDVRGSTALNGALTTSSTAILKVTGEGFASNGVLTVASGFTNNGQLELDFSNGAGGQTTQLVVTSGILVNAPTGTLRVTGNTPTATRILNTQLDNQGSLLVDAVTTVNARGASLNSGGMVLGPNGTLTWAFGAGSPTLSHTGTLTIPTGRSWTTTGVGTFTMGSLSTVDGGGSYASNNGAVTLVDVLPVLSSVGSTSGTLTLGADVLLSGMEIPLASATVDGSGGVEVSAGQSMLWRNSTVAVPVQIDGTLDTRGTTTISGSINTGSTAIWRVTGEGFASSALVTSSFGFTNNGVIEIDFVNGAGGQNSRLLLDTGTLVNGPTGIIRMTATTPTAQRYLQGTLINQGAVEVDADGFLVLAGTSSNSGSITIGSTGAVTLVQSGGGTLTNTGTITVPTGRSWTSIGNGAVNFGSAGLVAGGGAYASNSGTSTTFNMVPTLASVSSNGGTLNVGTGVTLGGMVINLTTATLGGPGAVALASGTSSLWRSSTITVPVALQGTLDVRGNTTLSGSLSTESASVLRVTGEGFAADGIFTVANGFTNNGLLELDYANANGGQVTRLIVSNGTLVNAASGTLRTTINTPLAGRFLNASLDNQGTLDLFPGAAGTLTHTGALTSTGTIKASLGGTTAGSGYGRMTVSSTAVVGGTLTIGLHGGFTPATGNTFDIVTSTGLLSGSFNAATLNGVSITPSILSNAVRVIAP